MTNRVVIYQKLAFIEGGFLNQFLRLSKREREGREGGRGREREREKAWDLELLSKLFTKLN